MLHPHLFNEPDLYREACRPLPLGFFQHEFMTILASRTSSRYSSASEISPFLPVSLCLLLFVSHVAAAAGSVQEQKPMNYSHGSARGKIRELRQ